MARVARPGLELVHAVGVVVVVERRVGRAFLVRLECAVAGQVVFVAVLEDQGVVRQRVRLGQEAMGGCLIVRIRQP